MPDAEPSPIVLTWVRPLKELSGRFSLPKANTFRGVFFRFIWEGTFASVFSVITQGGLLIALATYLKAGHWQISLISAMVFIVMPLQLILGNYLNSYSTRKRNTILTATIGRCLWIGPIILAVLQPKHAVWWFILFVFLMNLFLTLSALCWLSWVGDLIHKEIRGRFFGIRQRWMSTANVVTLVVAGIFMDWMKLQKLEGLGHFTIGTLAILAGLISTYLMIGIPKQLRSRNGVTDQNLQIHLAWKHPEYRSVLLGFAGWYAAIGFAGPYWAVHMLTYLKFSFTLLTGYGALFTITMAIVSPIVGKWIDKNNDFSVLIIGMLCLATLSIFWLFITPQFLFPIIPEIIITAIGWSAIQITSSTIPLKYSNESTRSSFISALAAVTGIGFTIGSLMGGWMMETISHCQGRFLSIPIYPTHFAFAMTAVFRFVIAIYFYLLLKKLVQGVKRESLVY
ncbi:MAG: MFS transporter [bacterium]|nr:MFS transporter [bacterium]